MTEDLEETPVEYGIPRFEFTNNRGETGWAEFVDIEDLTRREIKYLRKAIGSSVNEGEASNAFFDEALRILVTKWEVPGKPHIRAPRYDLKEMDGIPATFSAALEVHIRPHLQKLTKGEATDDGQPGSPHQPGRG